MGFFDKAKGKLKTSFKDTPTPPFQAGSSLRMQAEWRSLPEWKKNQLRRTLPDSDRDGVPDKFDCQPFNKNKQDYISVGDIIGELEQAKEGKSEMSPPGYRSMRNR